MQASTINAHISCVIHELGAWIRINGAIAKIGATSEVTVSGYLTGTLTAVVNGHKQSRIDKLLPWNYLVA